jgi:ketosteroid isomerase-like protein
VLVLAGFISLAQQEDFSSGEMREKEAIMKVIEEETAAYYANDIERWAATYLQDSTNVTLNASKAGYNFHYGWENILTMGRNIFNGRQANNREVKTPLFIKMYDDMAWVVFNNQVFNSDNQLVDEVIGTTILEKKDGKWKIVYRNSIWTNSYTQHEIFLINSLNYAKSLGKTVDEFASFTVEQFKSGWNNENFLSGVLYNWQNWTPSEHFKILEQDEDHITFTASNMFSNLRINGSVYNVSFDDYLSFFKFVFEKISEDLNVGYNQEITSDGVRVTVAKRVSAGK